MKLDPWEEDAIGESVTGLALELVREMLMRSG